MAKLLLGMRLFVILLVFMGAVNGFSAELELFPPDTSKGMVFDTPEIMPQFPGGPHALEDYIRTNVKYPDAAHEQGLRGKVYVQFIVEKDGSLSDIQVRMGRHQILNDEALRVVKAMPNWKPGSNRGKIVRVRYTLPIMFSH